MGASIWDPSVIDSAPDADSLTYTFATGAITRPVAERLRDRMYITDWDGANWDQRLDNALAYSYLNGNKAIHLPSIGTDYIFSDPHIITQGVMLWGDDSQGSSTNYGTVLQYDGVGDFLTWDGSATAANAHIYINGVEASTVRVLETILCEEVYEPLWDH